VLALDEAVTLRRRAAAAWLSAHGDPLPALRMRPSRIELAVLTTLAQTYGPALLDRADFTPVIDVVAECGAVVLVQRVLFGDAFGHAFGEARSERQEDVPEVTRLAARLLAARVPFEILCGTWPEVFMAQADIALQSFLQPPPRSNQASAPPEPPLESEDGERDDG
jgi:hypothetical protein